MSIPASEAASYDAWAEVYDSSDADRAPFIEFYRGLLRPGMGSLLELGCGTGTILSALATSVREGVPGSRIVGVDGSPGMLAVARRRDASIEWRLGDLRDPGVEGRFELVLCPFNTLQHLLGDEDLLAAFVAARDLLAPGGRYAFDIYRPNEDYLREPSSDRLARAFTDGTGRHLEIREDKGYDPGSRVLDLDWRLVHAQSPRGKPLATTHFRLRQHYPADVERLLAEAGLHVAEHYGDFDRSPFGAAARKQILVCKAA